jgi:putative transposase
VPQEDFVCRVTTASRRGIPEIGRAKGKQDRGRSSSAGSRAHVDLDPAKIRSVAGDRYIKGKSAIHLARVYGEKKRNFVGQHFWARGYFVSTVGRDTEVIRDYIKRQEEEDKRLEQMNLWR